MMIFSLPNYRHLSEAALERLRKDDGRQSSGRATGILFNVLLVAGLWGVPLYGRWVVLSHRTGPMDLREAILGKWRATEDSRFTITFTEDGRFVLMCKNMIFATARYRIGEQEKDEVKLDRFPKPGGEGPIPQEERCWFRAAVTEGALHITPSVDRWNGAVRQGKSWQCDDDRLELPPLNGGPAIFQRIE
jgi:hypothetical protein